jgi:hypothetical protein
MRDFLIVAGPVGLHQNDIVGLECLNHLGTGESDALIDLSGTRLR